LRQELVKESHIETLISRD